MTDDVLLPWIRAYRDEHPGTALDARAIRRRVLLSVGARQRRRLFAVRFVLPVAATFFGSVALAASHGALPRLDDVREWLGVPAPAPPPSKTPEKARRPKKATASERVAPALEAALRAAPSSEPEVRLSLDELPAEPVYSAPAQGPRSNPLKGDLTAYESAHHLHFHGGDSGAALAAWDAYLALHPGGTFAPEARFNRAVCLLRVGRRAEAKSALASIADDASSVYGRDRARALLDAME